MIHHYPDFNERFFICIGALNHAIEAELFQIGPNERHQTLGFASQTLTPPKTRYFTTESELLAILFAYTKFRNYILGHDTMIMTNHHVLTFMQSSRFLNGRITHWMLALQEYNTSPEKKM